MFEGKVGKGSVGADSVIQELEYSLVTNHFPARYLEWVKYNPNIWYKVPVGNSRGSNKLIPKCGPNNWTPPSENIPPMWLGQDDEHNVCA